MEVPKAAPARNHSRSQVQSDADASSQSAGAWVSDAAQRTLSSLGKDDFQRGQELALFKHKESRGSVPASARQQLARNEIVLGKAKGREGAIRTLYLLTGWRLLALSESSGRILTAIEGNQIQEVTLPTEHEEQAPGANARADALKVKSSLWKGLAWGSGAIMLAITALMPLFLPVVIVAVALFVLMNKGAGQATELECDAFEAGEETVTYLSFDILHRQADGVQRSRLSLVDDGDAEVFYELVEQVWEEWLEGKLSTGAALVTVAPESALPPQETVTETPRESSDPSQAAPMAHTDGVASGPDNTDADYKSRKRLHRVGMGCSLLAAPTIVLIPFAVLATVLIPLPERGLPLRVRFKRKFNFIAIFMVFGVVVFVSLAAISKHFETKQRAQRIVLEARVQKLEPTWDTPEQRDETIAVYKDLLEIVDSWTGDSLISDIADNYPTYYQRTVLYDLERGDTDSAKRYMRMAAKKGFYLQFEDSTAQSMFAKFSPLVHKARASQTERRRHAIEMAEKMAEREAARRSKSFDAGADLGERAAGLEYGYELENLKQKANAEVNKLMQYDKQKAVDYQEGFNKGLQKALEKRNEKARREMERKYGD